MEKAAKMALIAKHAKKFAMTKNGPPILEGVHYAEDGTVVVANLYCGLRIKNAHNYAEPITVSVVTGNKISGIYPYQRFNENFPTEFKASFSLSKNSIEDAFKKIKWIRDIAKFYDKRNKAIQLNVDGTTRQVVELKFENDSLKFEAYLSKYDDKETLSVTLNAEFLLNSLQVFKDAGTSELKIKLNDKIAPIILSDEENEIDVIILPIRTGA